MAKHIHLIVEGGPEKGREIVVPREGIRIGRSSRNDISMDDPALSRFHCRLYFDEEGNLWISDLGSANGTVVNDAEVEERKLAVGDVCSLGETTMRVTHIRREDAETGPAGVGGEPGINLGFGKGVALSGTTPLRRWLYLALAAMAVASILAWLPWGQWLKTALSTAPAEKPAAGPVEKFPEFDVSFERVEGSASNIFRFAMAISGHRLVVQVDDLATDRHVRREKSVAPELLEDLSRVCDQAGFFELLPEYEGVAPGIHEATDIAVTIGSRSHRVRALNHVEPEGLARLRGQLEEFSKNELGLAALAIEPGELRNRARETFLLGRKLFDEREVDVGNLAKAIRALTEAEWYLETIEPKPDFYAEILSRRSDCERELQRRYENLWFMAERSVKLRDWKEAAVQLRRVCEMIQDRSDDRHRNAYKKLVDVERRLATDKQP